MMLFVEDISKLVKIGIASCYLKNEKNYLNIILLGNPEIGKSSILLKFDLKRLKNVFCFTDATRSKLEKFFKELNNPKHFVKYLIIPDFTMLTAHGKDTQRNLLGLLNAGIEEGLREITLYYGGSIHETKTFEKPLKFGIATSATRQFMSDRRRVSYWFSIGFFSRLMPVSFSYTREQAKKIREHIARSLDIEETMEKLSLKETSVSCAYRHIKCFEPQIDKLAEAARLYGFRYTRQFRIMLKANALLRGSDKVTKKDVKEIMRLARYVNLDYNPVV